MKQGIDVLCLRQRRQPYPQGARPGPVRMPRLKELVWPQLWLRTGTGEWSGDEDLHLLNDLENESVGLWT